MTFIWADIEIARDVYDWSGVDQWLEEESRLGKPAGIGFSVYDGRCCGGNRAPRWLTWEDENTVVRCDAMNWAIPRYWNPTFLAAYRDYINAFAARYDGDPRLAWIEMGTGIFGEAKPADTDDWACLLDAGLSEQLWIDTSKEIMGYFAAAFQQTPILYQFAPIYNPESNSVRQRRELTDYAAGLGIGLKHNGLTPDYNFTTVDDPAKSYYKAGHWDPFFTWWRQVPTGWESYATQRCVDYVTGEISAGITLWCVYAGLNAHADYFVFSKDLVTDPLRADYLEFAHKYLGAELSDTDSVWVALREHEPLPGDWFPPRGNYSFGLYQNDDVPGGRSVPEWNVTTAPEGRYTRRTDRKSGNLNLYFDVEDNWLYQGNSSEVQIEVIYLDAGTDTWSLYYDALDTPEKLAGTIRKTDSDQWRTFTFQLHDAYFGNRLPGGGEHPGSDFYLASNDFDDTFLSPKARKMRGFIKMLSWASTLYTTASYEASKRALRDLGSAVLKGYAEVKGLWSPLSSEIRNLVVDAFHSVGWIAKTGNPGRPLCYHGFLVGTAIAGILQGRGKPIRMHPYANPQTWFNEPELSSLSQELGPIKRLLWGGAVQVLLGRLQSIQQEAQEVPEEVDGKVDGVQAMGLQKGDNV
jgi:hypothetical protein